MTVQEAQREELKKKLTPEQYTVTQECGTEPPFQQRLLGQPRARHLRRRRLGRAALLVDGQVRLRHRLAELHQAARAQRGRRRRDVTHGMVRTEVRSQARRLAPGPRLRRRPARPGRAALLHQLRVAALHPRRASSRPRATAQYAALFGLAKRRDGDAPRAATGDARSSPGGCFWGMEDMLRKIPGVLDTEVGYTGGWLKNPTLRRHPRQQVGPRRVGEGRSSTRAKLSTRTCSRSGSSACTTRPRSTARATTSARSTARPSSTRSDAQRRPPRR